LVVRIARPAGFGLEHDMPRGVSRNVHLPATLAVNGAGSFVVTESLAVYSRPTRRLEYASDTPGSVAITVISSMSSARSPRVPLLRSTLRDRPG
jgi:hypothetical protein